MAFFDNVFKYIDPIAEGITENEIPSEMELPQGWTKELLEELSDTKRFISERNSTGAYIVPIDEKKVVINMLPQKRVIKDSDLKKVTNKNFETFVDIDYQSELEPTLTLPEGEFFRVANEGVKPIEEYQYFIVQNGDIAPIPNFKTLEVMLAERNKTYNSVRVIEVKDFEMISKAAESGNASGTAIDTSGIPDEAAANNISAGGGGGASSVSDKSSEWTEDMKAQTMADSFEELTETADSAEQIVQAATDAAQQNIDAAMADAEAARAEADAARAEAEAAIAAAEAAIAEAESEEDAG